MFLIIHRATIQHFAICQKNRAVGGYGTFNENKITLMWCIHDIVFCLWLILHSIWDIMKWEICSWRLRDLSMVAKMLYYTMGADISWTVYCDFCRIIRFVGIDVLLLVQIYFMNASHRNCWTFSHYNKYQYIILDPCVRIDWARFRGSSIIHCDIILSEVYADWLQWLFCPSTPYHRCTIKCLQRIRNERFH